MSNRMQGKVALVSGAASGIGRSCAIRLAGEGASVLVTDVQVAMGQETVASIEQAGGTAVFFEHDVTSEQAWVDAITLAQSKFGALHVLVNNAGIGVGGSIIEMSLDDWQRQQAINLDGVFLGIKHGIPLMRDSGGGSIVNISSVAGIKGSPRLAGYCATKGGVRLLTKAVARECAMEGWPIRVNSVHPGVIATPIWNTVGATSIDPENVGANAVDPDELAKMTVPSGVAGKPIDIANGVLFLASDESTYITGTELVIDAGITA